MEQFTLEDLAMAYRKAKVDVYYSSNARRLDLLEYESNLEGNLIALMDRVNGDDDAWVTDSEFLGSAYLMPKDAKVVGEGTDAEVKSRWSDPRENWAAAKRGAKRAEYSFRVMALCSIDFHVLSSLWVSAVGAHLEAELSDASRGNRLRRKAVGTPKVSPNTGTPSGKIRPRKPVGEFNDLASGSFGPYMHPYRKWRDEGMTAARDALNAKRDVVVISADLASYYHSLDASFLDRDGFLALFNFELTDRARRLNRLFSVALNAWPQAAQKALGFEVRGLPVGLPISGVVANLALMEFDQLVEAEVRPLYYGRYVDDLLIVLPDVGPVDGTDMWAWLATRLDGILTVDDERQRIHRDYLDGSVIQMNAAKSMTLHLSGKSGLALVGSIERTIHARASEWRSLPSLSDDPQEIVTDIAQVFQADGDLADSFRTVDLMSARRSAFAMRLRDYEAYEADLNPASWAAQRSAFYEAVVGYALSVPGYFELAAYIMRVVKIAAASGDFDAIERMILNLARIREAIELESRVTVKGARRSRLLASRVAKKWAMGVARQIAEVIACAVASEPKTEAVQQVNDALARLTGSRAVRLRAAELFGLSRALADADLGHVPFRSRFITLGQPSVRKSAGAADRAESFARLLPTHVVLPLQSLERLLPRTARDRRKVDRSIPNGIAYSTRPFGLVELFIMASPDLDNVTKFNRVMDRVRDAVLAQRGYDASEMLPSLSPDRGKDLIVPRDKASGTRRVAVGMVATTDASWAAAAKGNPDLTPVRHRALSDAINEVLRAPRGVDYFTLPELSVPWTWFVRFAQKLRSQDIGLIAGVEYLHGRNKTVHNQVWASLPLDGSDFPGTYLHRQDKMTPAIHEAAGLTAVAGRHLKAERAWSTVPIIRHGEFAFGMLVCSELTNIEYRSQLRGRVDAVFLPAWNQDLNTFSALVEAAALDIHAYVILTNDRAYGDSRIRAPMKQDWERDIVRLRGGVENYVVIAEVDIKALRAHHNTKRPNGPRFKPLPDGFKVSQGRRGPSLGPGGH